MRLHARIAAALEELYAGDLAAHAAELAHHYAEAGPVTGQEKLVHCSLMAGEQALAKYEWEDAVDFFDRALAARQSEQMDEEIAAILFGLGRAQKASLERHQLQHAVDNLTRAFEYYVQAGDVDRAIEVVQGPGVRQERLRASPAIQSSHLTNASPCQHPSSHLVEEASHRQRWRRAS